MIPQTPFDRLSANENMEALDILEKRNPKNAISLFANTFLSGNSIDSVLEIDTSSHTKTFQNTLCDKII